MLRKVLLAVITMSLIIFSACSSGTKSSEIASTSPKITLADASDILNISFLLPSRFEQVDAASEGMSNADMGLGSDCSEVQLYMSEDPFQMIYGFMAVYGSRIEGAIFDRQIEDEDEIENMLTDAIISGAEEEGVDLTVPNIEITHPDVGDSAILGEGSLESYGFYFGFDVIFFRIDKTYVFLYSVSMTEDKVSLITIAQEIESRIREFSQ